MSVTATGMSSRFMLISLSLFLFLFFFFPFFFFKHLRQYRDGLSGWKII